MLYNVQRLTILTIAQPVVWHNVRVLNKRPFTLRQVNQTRGDLYAIVADRRARL